MNPQDQDRLNSKARNAQIVDLDAYRAAHQSRAAAPYLDPVTTSWLAWGALIAALFFAFAFTRR